MTSLHDITAMRIASRYGAPYNDRQGPDIVTPFMAIEVETTHTISDAFRQLQGFRMPVYIAGADNAATSKAVTAVQSTDVGVMNPNGDILIQSTRR